MHRFVFIQQKSCCWIGENPFSQIFNTLNLQTPLSHKIYGWTHMLQEPALKISSTLFQHFTTSWMASAIHRPFWKLIVLISLSFKFPFLLIRWEWGNRSASEVHGFSSMFAIVSSRVLLKQHQSAASTLWYWHKVGESFQSQIHCETCPLLDGPCHDRCGNWEQYWWHALPVRSQVPEKRLYLPHRILTQIFDLESSCGTSLPSLRISMTACGNAVRSHCTNCIMRNFLRWNFLWNSVLETTSRSFTQSQRVESTMRKTAMTVSFLRAGFVEHFWIDR